MAPTYHSWQLVILNKHDRNYVVGDVIAIQCDGLDTIIVKRISEKREDGYFVLGDNLEESIDSRDARVGLILEKDIIGKVVKD